jgi:multiple sugar transport system substrate-binding protein
MDKQKKIKKVALWMTSMLLIGLLTACGGGTKSTSEPQAPAPASASSEKTAESTTVPAPTAKAAADFKGEFVLWTWEPEHKTALAAFNKIYPNIKMKVVNVAAGDVPKKLQTTIASGGELPDVIRIEAGQKAKIFDMDILSPLEEAPFSADTTKIFDYDVPAFTVKDHLVAIPDDMSLGGLAYIKPLAKTLFGTDDPKELEALLPDWDTFIQKGKEAVDKSGGKVKMFPSLGDAYVFIREQRSAPFFDGDKLNSTVLKEVLTSLVKFRDSGIVDKLDQWTPAWNASFGTSKYVFAMSPVWMPQYVIGANDKNPPRWGLMVAPNGGYITGGSSHGIPKGAKNAEFAWKWIEFTSMTQEGALAQKTDGVFTHFAPAYKDKDFANWTWPNFGDQNIGEKYFVDISAKTKTVAVNVNDNILSDAMGIVLQTMTKDPSFGMDQALDRITKELKAKAPNITIQ